MKLSFKTEGEIKSFSDKQKSKKGIAGRPALQEILKEVLLERRKMIEIRNSDLRWRCRKSIEEEISEGKVKIYFSDS